MDYTPYLPRSGEDESEYYHRVWLSDLWDKVSTMEYQGIPNNAIQTVIVMKRFVFSRNCQELVSLMKTFEDRVLERKTDLLFCEWAKVYCRRIYRRKNTAFRTAPPAPAAPVPKTETRSPRTTLGIAFSGKRI